MADIGDEKILRAEFYDEEGTLTNPDVVTITVLEPDGATSSPAITNPSVGIFEARYQITKSGTFWWRATGSGAVKAAGERTFVVNERQVP